MNEFVESLYQQKAPITKYKNKIMKNVRSKIFTAILAYVVPIAINYLMNRFLNKKSKPQVKSTL